MEHRDHSMAMDIREELRGKNPRRVAPQLRRTLVIHRQRVIAAAIMAAVVLGFGLGGFVLEAISGWLQVVAFVMLPVLLLALCADAWVYRKQRERLCAVEQLIADQRDA